MGPDPAGSHSRFKAAMKLRMQEDVPALSARLPCNADYAVDSKQVGSRCAGKEPAPEVVRFLGVDGQGWSVRVVFWFLVGVYSEYCALNVIS